MVQYMTFPTPDGGHRRKPVSQLTEEERQFWHEVASIKDLYSQAGRQEYFRLAALYLFD